MKTITKLKLKLILFYILSFIVCVAPLVIVVIINRNEWFGTPQESVKIGIGAVIGIVLICLKVLGKIKIPKKIVIYGLVFAMTYLLGPILEDLLLLSGMAFLGELLDLIFFQRKIRKTKELIKTEKTADVTSEKVEKVFEKYVGSGRT